MLGFRPRTSALYLRRDRLLRLFPEEAGFVVWLEAPYGYGKSVLASQWAETLEPEGWRILWLSAQGRDLKAALADLLNLSSELAWGQLLDGLWSEPTLVVLEDLEGGEELNPLLKDVRGLLLLASRKSLALQELPRLATQGRLLHLQAKDLAFDITEAKNLFDDEDAAKLAWERSQGWSLPLHFSALTGETLETEALIEGLKDSLSEMAWQELLFLASLPYLPATSANEASKELVRKGFAQELESAYRLHPLTAEAVQHEYLEAMRQNVRPQLPRLSLVLQAEALACTGLFDDLNELMETSINLAIHDAQGYLRWDALCPLAKGPGRLLGLSWALSVTGQLEPALKSYNAVIEHPNASPEQKLIALGWHIFDVGPTETLLAAQLIERARPLFARAEPKLVSSFLHNASGFYLNRYDWEAAEALIREGLGYAEQITVSGEPVLQSIQTYLAIVNWELRGDLESLIAVRFKGLNESGDSPFNTVNNHYNLGKLLNLISDTNSLSHFEEAEQGAKHHLVAATSARAEKAALLGDALVFSSLISQVLGWQTILPSTLDRIYALWAKTLRHQGQASAALEVLASHSGSLIAIERSLCFNALGEKEAALAALPEQGSLKVRSVRLEYQAARYLISKEPQDLDQLIELSLSRERILPAFIPLAELPKERSELSLAYPLSDVLNSGWQDAITRRFAEIPQLELTVLGDFKVKVLGKDIELTDRHKAILALLSLGYNREVIGEALWPETDSKKVLNNLHVQLNFLRKLLEPWNLKTYLTETGLERCQADIWQLQAALKAKDADLVLKLYQEPFAPGVDLATIDEARDALKQNVIELLFEAAQMTEQAGTYLEKIMELDPLYEEALQLLLEDLLKRGRRREAQRRLYGFTAHLKRELGLEPLEETLAILN